MSEVIIVGAGPAGLAAALALRAHGLRPRILESRARASDITGSRALFVHHDSLALLETISPGLGQAIAATGIRWARRETRYAGRVVYSRAENHTPLGDGLPSYTSLGQSGTGELLVDACTRNGMDVEWSTTVHKVASSDDRVTLTTDSWTAHADFVIGADGARSRVRESLGIELQGPRISCYHIVADVLGGKRDCRTLHYSCPEVNGRTAMYVPFAGGYQIDIQCHDQADAARLADTRSWVPPDDVTRLAWVSNYRFIRAVASSFIDAHRRVLLVGEAAHLFPPFGARGMNSAFADAVAAATAIALASSVKSTAAITRYENERRTAALINADTAYHAYRHLHPSRSMRATQWGAAQASLLAPGAGRWLEHSAYGPRVRTGGRY
jgi:3-(3-hydroxy-phenyl)propionate hydroxylase